jgi:hypothetical protein
VADSSWTSIGSNFIGEEHTMRFVIHTCAISVVSWLVAMSAAAQSPMHKVRLVPADALASLSWTSLASDPKDDVLQPRLPDAKELSCAIDQNADLIWFKVSVHEPLPERWFGINVAVDIDDKPENGMTWWGTNKVKFDRLASAYLSRTEDDWQGYAGVADSESVGRGDLSNLTREVKVALDREHRAILLGIPRSTLGTAPTVRVIATVGSMIANNDDVPNEGMITVKLKP